MTEQLFVWNKEDQGNVVDLYQCPDLFPPLRSDDGKRFFSNLLRSVDGLINPYFSANSLFCRLETVEQDALFDVFISDIVNITTFFKFTDTETNPDLFVNNFHVTQMSKDIISLTGFSMEINLSNDSLQSVRDFFRSSNIAMPRYGMLQFSIIYSDGSTKTYACKITNEPLFSIDTPLSGSDINSFTTSGQTYENLFVPEFTGTFVYNFYQTNEENEAIFRAKNYSNYILDDIPKFIKLSWTKTPISPTSTSTSTRIDGLVFSNPNPTQSPSTAASFNPFDMFHINIDPIIAGSESPPTDSGGVNITSMPPLPTQIPIPIALNITNSSYVGYVIKKEKLDPETGDFIPIENIVINNPNRTEFIDWKIAYGETYRYQIRSLFRFVNKDNISIYEDSNSLLTRQQDLDIFGTRTINSYLYFFDSSFSVPQTIECIDLIRPNAPSQLMIFPNSKDGNILITWCQKNPNQDVAGFNVYRKELYSNEIFKKLNSKLLDIRNNFYIDYNIDIEKKYIYAIESIDVHGNFSPLSMQLIANINNFDIDIGRNEEKPQFFAIEGLELLQSPDIEKNTKYTYFKNKFLIKINPVFNEAASNQKFILRIMSIDTLITKEIRMKFKLTSITKRAARPIVSDVNQVIGPNIIGGRDISTVTPSTASNIAGSVVGGGNIQIRI